MKTTEIRVTVGKTVNTGNYTSVRVEFTETVVLEDGDSRVNTLKKTTQRLKNFLLEEEKDLIATHYSEGKKK